MAFTSGTFTPLSAHANSDAPKMMSYTTADNIATTEGASYFNSSFVSGQCSTGDVLLCVMSDGTKLYKLTVNKTTFVVSVSTGTAIA
jgi:hypothetical protein